jgi:hypothetical protein
LRAQDPDPSQIRSNYSLFFVGKDFHGAWVAQDQSGQRGGLFVDQEKAVKFALSENGNRPQAVILVPGVLELDANAKPRFADHLVVFSQKGAAPAQRYGAVPLPRRARAIAKA